MHHSCTSKPSAGVLVPALAPNPDTNDPNTNSDVLGPRAWL